MVTAKKASSKKPAAAAGKKTLVTAGLPYANGPIHIGHIVEYVQADIFTRFLKLFGRDAIYICADDTHGTPIEINAAKQGITPEELVKKCFAEHNKDFADFEIEFDNYYTTNSPENKDLSDLFFNRLKDAGHIYTKEIELAYCPNCKRYLPDRYVKGTCPNCKSPDQYGDVCENCNSAYKTTDLIDPYCVVCKTTPIRKMSNHYFFRLSSFSDKLKKWITENPNLQQDIKNFILNWIKNGLEDWCISRDGPYFGFKVPGEENKFYYVWLDAPIGYLASTLNYCKKKGIDADEYFYGKNSEMIHFIGKDIIYFHFLFWPAMLMGAGFNLPSKIHVHGFLNVGKEKMSKSKGTFLTARDYLNELDPEFLRFYYAGNLSSKMMDISLDFDDFKDRVNNELVSNIANFAYRTLSFINANFDSALSTLPDDDASKTVLKRANGKAIDIAQLYENIEFREAVKEILAFSTIGNQYFQEREPWKLIKEDREKTRQLLTLFANLVRDLAVLVKPIIPRFSKSLEDQLGLKNLSWKDIGTPLQNVKISDAKIIFKKLEKIQLGSRPASDEFSCLDLRVAKILSLEDHPSAEKLYILQLDLGKEKRQLVAGLKPYMAKEELAGKNIVIIANLKYAKLRGVESQGMLLAADDGKKVIPLAAPKSMPGDRVYIKNVVSKPKPNLEFKDFIKLDLKVMNKKATHNGRALQTDSEEIAVDIADGSGIR